MKMPLEYFLLIELLLSHFVLAIIHHELRYHLLLQNDYQESAFCFHGYWVLKWLLLVMVLE